jgi:hypothetical protein
LGDSLSFFLFLCRPLPHLSPPRPTTATPVMAAAEELQELLLAWEEELMQREEVLAMWEEKARISEKSLTKVSDNLDAERAKVEATRKDYLDKMEAHTTRVKHSFGLDKMLGEKKVKLDGREWDLSLCEAVLVEVLSWGLNPRDNCEELMESIELWRFLQDSEVDRVIEAGRLAFLVRDVSKVLTDLGTSPIPGIPRDPRTTDDVL